MELLEPPSPNASIATIRQILLVTVPSVLIRAPSGCSKADSDKRVF